MNINGLFLLLKVGEGPFWGFEGWLEVALHCYCNVCYRNWKLVIYKYVNGKHVFGLKYD